MNHKKRIAALLIAAATLPPLAGCFPAVATGVGAGTLMLLDRRSSGIYIEDEGIEIKALARISEKYGDRVHVNATSFNRSLLLTGEATTAEMRSDIEHAAAAVPNVKQITNEIVIAAPSSYAARSSDAYITSKIKARFVESSKFSANHVKVVTEAGVVYLMGMVTTREAEAATDIARTTGGAKKVVRVFEYLSEQQAADLDRRSGAKK